MVLTRSQLKYIKEQLIEKFIDNICTWYKNDLENERASTRPGVDSSDTILWYTTHFRKWLENKLLNKNNKLRFEIADPITVESRFENDGSFYMMINYDGFKCVYQFG